MPRGQTGTGQRKGAVGRKSTGTTSRSRSSTTSQRGANSNSQNGGQPNWTAKHTMALSQVIAANQQLTTTLQATERSLKPAMRTLGPFLGGNIGNQ